MFFGYKKKSYFWVITLLTLLFIMSACRRGGGTDIPEIGIDLSVSPNPPSVGPSLVTLSLAEADGSPLTGAEVELEGNMSHAGMTPVFTTANEVEPGIYEAPLEFTMGGDWFILVKATLPDGRQLERQINLPGVGAQ